MRVANYYRVSTKMQEDKFSLPAQKQELKAYATQQGWNIVGEFKDVESGGKLKKDGLNNLLDLVEEGGVDVVLVVDQDRLSRLDTVAWEYLKSTLRDNKVKIAEPGSIIDLANEDDEFISDIKNLIARREKKAIVRRMMRGKRQRMREGKAWGIPPFEYTYNRNTAKYEAKEEWKWVIPFIDDLYLNKQLGMKSISDKLNEISTTPTGNKWNEHLIHTRLTTKAYHGVMEKEFNTGEIISTPGIYEPLRTEETYKKLQIERKKRNEQFSVSGRQNSDNIHLLRRTFLTCGHCGRKILVAMHGSKKNPKWYAKHGRKARLNGEVCDISINTVRFDDNILNALKSILTSEEMAKEYIKIEHDEDEITGLKAKIKNADKTVSELRASLDRLLDLYLLGKIKKDKYLDKEKELTTKLDMEEESLGKLKRKLDVIDSSSFTYESLYQYMEIAQNIETEITNLERAQLIGTLFPEGIVYRDKLVLITEIFKGIPLEVTIPIEPDPNTWHHTKKHIHTSL
ncbi:recombinase family protein [Oceanobacillus caeni]|uniref:recombinase family protein n=1 Tax=Oceanobacillus caeni TaxID=405946 RepID=UPI002149C406|nr:recombinase family protein [Oceanobacillus caeni]MCR1835013.1 recombinase family protein [Oceanobacillus caeni]